MFECRVEADSVSPAGKRLTTFVVTFPRFILAEFNTHRALSRNAASSRAIPVERRVQAILDDPFVPEFAANKKGMQAGEVLEGQEADAAKWAWLQARDQAVYYARMMQNSNVHKQWANRLLEPFAWVTVIASATDWNNFFALRCHPDAQPEFQRIAGMMREAREASKPREIGPGDWHLPFLDTAERQAYDDSVRAGVSDEFKDQWRRVSVGRSARVSYETHDGRRDLAADLVLADRLIAALPRHSSPAEHPATPCDGRSRNFDGWQQYRTFIADDTVLG